MTISISPWPAAWKRSSRTASSLRVFSITSGLLCCEKRLLVIRSGARAGHGLGGGRAVIRTALGVDLTHRDVLQILTAGFLPITEPGEMPARGRPTGLRELGLPFANDPAITKHLAAFLTQAAVAMSSSSANHRMVRPDAVLFNGGFFAPAAFARGFWAISPVWRFRELAAEAP